MIGFAAPALMLWWVWLVIAGPASHVGWHPHLGVELLLPELVQLLSEVQCLMGVGQMFVPRLSVRVAGLPPCSDEHLRCAKV